MGPGSASAYAAAAPPSPVAAASSVAASLAVSGTGGRRSLRRLGRPTAAEPTAAGQPRAAGEPTAVEVAGAKREPRGRLPGQLPWVRRASEAGEHVCHRAGLIRGVRGHLLAGQQNV